MEHKKAAAYEQSGVGVLAVQSGEVWEKLAAKYAHHQDYILAEDAFQQALSHRTHNAPATRAARHETATLWLGLGDAMFHTGRINAAIRAGNSAVAIFPGDDQVRTRCTHDSSTNARSTMDGYGTHDSSTNLLLPAPACSCLPPRLHPHRPPRSPPTSSFGRNSTVSGRMTTQEAWREEERGVAVEPVVVVLQEEVHPSGSTAQARRPASDAPARTSQAAKACPGTMS